MTRLATKCPETPTTIMYFYGNIDECPDCGTTGEVLTYLRKTYPDDLRIYSFDYNLELSALDTLKSIYKINKQLPALVINDNTYYGSTTIDQMKEIIPKLKKIDKQREIEEEKKAKKENATTSKNSSSTQSIKK
jgi:glutaredoxin